MKNKIKKIFKILTVAAGCLVFASFSPSLDGRAVVVEDGVFPQGLFAKTVGYLPGDIISVTNIAGDTTIDLLVIGALDPSEGVAIMLSPEAADAMGIDKSANNIVKITKRSGQEERVYGNAVISKSASEIDDWDNSNFETISAEENTDAFDDTTAEELPDEAEEESSFEEAEEQAEDESVEDEDLEEESFEAEAEDEAADEEETLEEEAFEEEEPEEFEDEAEAFEDEETFEEEAELEEEPETEAEADDEEAVEEEAFEEEAEEYPEENAEEEIESEEYTDEEPDALEEETEEAFEEEAPEESETVDEETPEEEAFDEEELEESVDEEAFEESAPEELENAEETPASEAFEADELEELPSEEEAAEESEEPAEEFVEEESEEYEAIVLVPVDSNPPQSDNDEVEDVVTEDEIEQIDDVIILEPLTESITKSVIEKSESASPAVKTVTGNATSYDKYIVPSLKDLQSGKYYIQIAVYSSDDNILEVINKYGTNYPITIVPMAGGNKKQILVGPVSMDEYKVVLERFKSYGFKDAFLRKVK